MTKKGKDTATLSYITIIGTIIAIFMNQEENKSEFASFHIRQALGIFVIFFALGYPIGYFDSWKITGAFYLFIFLLWIYSFIGCLTNKKRETPIIGKISQQIFKKI